MKTYETASIASSAMTVSVRISVYGSKKRNTQVSEEVAQSKGADRAAGTYFEDLFCGSDKLAAVLKLRGVIRNWVNQNTAPWGDDGIRLLPTSRFFDFRQDFGKYESEFNTAVQVFLDDYDNQVALQSFKRGSLFNKNEYPSRQEIESKFGIRAVFAPIPLAGDWRVEIGEQGKTELAEQYEAAMESRIQEVMEEAWERLRMVLSRMIKQLTPVQTEEEGKRGRKIYESLIDDALELCDMLTGLNITGDTKLEAARQELETALVGADVKVLRKSEGMKAKMLHDVNAIIAKMEG